MSIDVVIRGLGFHVPDRILTNSDLEQMVDTSDEWITTRTGIKERRIVEPGTKTSELAFKAAQKALADANMPASSISHILVPTITPDMPCPSTANFLAERLGLKGRMAMDCSAACSGFVFSLQLARGLTCLERDAVVLITATDILSSRTNYHDRSTCVLFGDGSGAAVVTADDGSESLALIRDVMVSTDGEQAELLTVKGGGSAYSYRDGMPIGDEYYIEMNGREVYKHAVRNMESISKAILERNNLGKDDIDLFLPHQANLRIIEGLTRKLDVPADKVFVNVDRYGNTSAASIPIALTEAKETGRIKPGYRVLVTTFGAGFTWGSALLEF